MRTTIATTRSDATNAIPLLDASSLPFEDDWALLESINPGTGDGLDFEPDADRLGRFNVSASYDE
ncbi:MAG TPA: hypothetical protein VFJ25_01690 [Casimicrobiaceae bacterium]|nr:hypothetical protein [Casimicrobiaceae bacterium]